MSETTLNLIILCTGITYILYRMYVILNMKPPELILDQEFSSDSDSNSESNSESNSNYYLDDFITEENTRKRKRKINLI
jgi:hypothetical protein